MPSTVRSPVPKRKKLAASMTAAPSSTGQEGPSGSSPRSPEELVESVECSEKAVQVVGGGSGTAGAEKGVSDEPEGNTGKSEPSTSESGMAKTVGKLDDSAYKPFGMNSNPTSRSNSDVESDSDVCKGGPGRETCGETVDDGVQCDKCGFWFHSLCQKIPKPAVTALRKHKVLSWFCHECKPTISANKKNSSDMAHFDEQIDMLVKVIQEHKDSGDPNRVTSSDFHSLESKIERLGTMVQKQVKMVECSMKEQEKAAQDHTMLIKRSFVEQNSQKASYADMLKSTCTNVVKEVNAKLETLPHSVNQNTMNRPDAVRDISQVFDNYMDKDKRKLNVVVHNLPEEPGETLAERSANDQAAFQGMLREALKLNVSTTKAFRAGKKLPDRPRLLIVTVGSLEAKLDLLKMASQLRNTNWSNVYINPDLSKHEREEGKKLRAELRARRQAGETNVTIRHGRVVQIGRMAGHDSSPPQLNAVAQQQAEENVETGSTTPKETISTSVGQN